MTKRGVLDYSSALLCAALLFNQAGSYALFDRQDGSNLACDIDPTCRPVTAKEIEVARPIFGDAIDYRHVSFFSRPKYFLLPRGNSGQQAFGGIYDTRGLMENDAARDEG